MLSKNLFENDFHFLNVLLRRSAHRFTDRGLLCTRLTTKHFLQGFIRPHALVHSRNSFATCPDVDQQVDQFVMWRVFDYLLMNMHTCFQLLQNACLEDPLSKYGQTRIR